MNPVDSTIVTDGGSSATGATADGAVGATTESVSAEPTAIARVDRWLSGALFALALALAANAVVGPLVTGTVTFPFSETLYNQTLGLEAVTLGIVVPWTLVAALLIVRGHRAGVHLAIPPAGYTVYMFAQYVVGPSYLAYRPIVALHLGIVILAGIVLAVAFHRARPNQLPDLSARRERLAGLALLAFAAFTVTRYLPAFLGMPSGEALSAEFAADPAMFWSIFLLDLGIVVPVAAGVGLGVRRGRPWAHRALYGVAGWFVLVPISVAAMGLAMWRNDDPNAALASVAMFAVVAVLFTAIAAWIYRPLVQSPVTREQ